MRPCAAAVAGVLVPAALVVAGAPAATASCAEGSGPAGSPVVFVGTAGEQRGSYTRFAVSEVWQGPDLAPEVWLLTGQEQPPWPLSLVLGVSSSNDATLTSGERYVVGASEDFATGACSIDEASTEATAGQRPEEARPPVDAGGAEGADPPLGAVGKGLVGAAVVATLGAVLVVRRRRRHNAT
jgi:hypothetical protein